MSGLLMTPRKMPLNMQRCFVMCLALLAPAELLGQTNGTSTPTSTTGVEVYLQGSRDALVGRSYRLRGRAYEVRGLADLQPLPDAPVRARYRSFAKGVRPGRWASGVADREGRFSVDIPIPSGALGRSSLEVRVGEGGESRTFTEPVALRSPLAVDLRTDRVLYEPGETVRVWLRVWDIETGAPRPGISARFVLASGSVATREQLETTESGVATWSVPLAETADAGPRSLEVHVGEGAAVIHEDLTFRVGQRATDRLATTVEVSPREVNPGENVDISVTVRTPSGSPVAGAAVRIVVGARINLAAQTDVNGVASLSFDAPAYLSRNTSYLVYTGEVVHPAHGSIDLRGSVRVIRPQLLEIDAIALHGGLIPEVNDELLISVLDGTGEALEDEDAEVIVSGPAVRGGRVRRPLDRHGIARIPTRTPIDAVAEHRGDDDPCDGRRATSIRVEVGGEHSRVANLCIPVLYDALVVPTVRTPVISPGDELVVEVERRPRVSQRPVVVDLLSKQRRLLLVESVVLPPGANVARLRAPADRVGLFQVRARPIMEEESVEGHGALDAIIIRPATPGFVSVAADREVYSVRGTATISIDTGAEASGGWVALLVRDLAVHRGERPFTATFLEGAFDRAVLEPTTADAETLLRAALAAHVQRALPPHTSPPLVDELGLAETRSRGVANQARGELRDPVLLGDELRRRGIQRIMTAVEELVTRSLDNGSMDRISTGTGRSRRLRDDVVALSYARRAAPKTLGGGTVTMSMLTAEDRTFTFDNVASRVARRRLVRLLGVLATYLDPPDDNEERARGATREPPERWLSRLVQLGLLHPTDLRDPWGGTYVIHRTSREPAVTLAVEAAGLELLSPGPDGIAGTNDDIRDPFARVVPSGTQYALASGEDELMRTLSTLVPGGETLSALLAAYRRLSDEALEELQGDVALAGTSEDALGALMGNEIGDNFGYGGLGLSGTGRGGGGTGHGTIGLGTHNTIGRVVRSASGTLASVIRERFPATLLFVGEARLDSNGTTEIELPLADAVTTYIVEAVVWRADGWVWSASTRVRVEQEIVVDAPVPAVAVVGDSVRLPLRVSNRTGIERRVSLRARISEELGVTQPGPVEVVIPPHDSRNALVGFTPGQVGDGHVVVEALDVNGRRVDGSRRPMTVVEDLRRAQREEEQIIEGQGAVEISIPQQARAYPGSGVQIAVGAALFFPRNEDTPSAAEAWAAALAGRPPRATDLDAALAGILLEPSERRASAVSLARAIGALWSVEQVSDEQIETALTGLVTVLGESFDGERASAETTATVLLLLSPAARSVDVRPRLADPFRSFIGRLREHVGEEAATRADAPWLWVRIAAALRWSDPAGERSPRVEELARRLDRSIVTVGDDLWLEGGAGDVGDQLIVATALLALCDLHGGSRNRAFRLLRTAARLTLAEGGNLPEARALNPASRAIASAVAAMMADGRSPDFVNLTIDGVQRRVALERGIATVPVEALGAPGTHRIGVDAVESAVVYLSARSVFGIPWEASPRMPCPFRLSLDGEIGRLDGRSQVVLEIQNITPRLVSRPTIELVLPAGAEVDETARVSIASQGAGSPDFVGRTLTMVLHPLWPGATRRIALPVRWTIAGRLRGFGAVAYAEDRPQLLSVMPTRAVEISEAGRTQ